MFRHHSELDLLTFSGTLLCADIAASSTCLFVTGEPNLPSTDYLYERLVIA